MSEPLARHPSLRRWWATLQLDSQRTCDVLIVARSQWSASWLARTLHPGVTVLMVRPVDREGPAG
jgi:hypothetical protein